MKSAERKAYDLSLILLPKKRSFFTNVLRKLDRYRWRKDRFRTRSEGYFEERKKFREACMLFCISSLYNGERNIKVEKKDVRILTTSINDTILIHTQIIQPHTSTIDLLPQNERMVFCLFF